MKLQDKNLALEFVRDTTLTCGGLSTLGVVRLADAGALVGPCTSSSLTEYRFATAPEVQGIDALYFDSYASFERFAYREFSVDSSEIVTMPTSSSMAIALRILDRFTGNNWWLWRENMRYLSGDYKTPEFYKYLIDHPNPNLRQRLREMWWTFPHVSASDPELLAYTQSPLKGLADIQTPTRVGRFVQKYFGDVLTPEDIRELANMCKGNELHWATTGEEMEDVYRNGPSSCMAHSRCDYGFHDIHPVMAYEGEFRLAYLKKFGRVTARAMVHWRSQTFPRVYGEEGQTLREMLERDGFEYASFPEGAQLKALQEGGRYAMPYIDGDNHYVSFIESRGVFVIKEYDSDHNYCARSTQGWWSAEPLTRYCEHCGDDVEIEDDDEDWDYSESEGYSVCPHCINHHFTYAYSRMGNMDWVRSDNVVEVGDRYYDTNHISDYDVVYSEYTNEYLELDDAVSDRDGDYMPADQALKVIDEDGEEQFIYITTLGHLLHENALTFEISKRDTCTVYDGDASTQIDTTEHEWFVDDFGTLVSTTVFTAEQLYYRVGMASHRLEEFFRRYCLLGAYFSYYASERFRSYHLNWVMSHDHHIAQAQGE